MRERNHCIGRLSFYISECSVVKGQVVHKMNVAEVKMLRWICNHTKGLFDSH